MKTPERNHGADWLKWTAILSMCIDHLKYINTQTPWNLTFELSGRAAFPLFAILVGWNLACHSKKPGQFIIRILLAGIGMEILKIALIPNNTGSPHLNSFITLGFGALLAQACIEIKKQNFTWRNATQAFLIAFLIILIAPICDYGITGILLPTFVALTLPKTRIQRIPSTALSYLTNPVWIYSIPAALTTWIGLGILTNTKIRPCPLPNSRWLYLSLPASFLPAFIYNLLIR